jgi:3-hydroxymyristoyl/3-hydroxydecanoyl-(acyl carrier protein) dehydratase
MELTMVTRKSKICQMQGKAFVDGALVAEAEMMASIIERTDSSISGAQKRS